MPYGDGSRSRLQRRSGVERVFSSFWANGGKVEEWQRGLARDVGRVEFHAAGTLPAVPRLAAGAMQSTTQCIKALDPGLPRERRPKYSLERLRALVLRTESMFGDSPALMQKRGAKFEITRLSRIRLALRAVGGWQMMPKKRLLRILEMASGSEEQVREMGRVQLGTLTASTSCIVVIVRFRQGGAIELRSASAHVYLTLLGCPIREEFCLRRCLLYDGAGASEVRKRAAGGQSLDFDVTRALYRRLMPDLLGCGEVLNVVESHAGISVFAAVLTELVGVQRVRILVSAEVVRVLKQMHRVGFGDVTESYCMLSYETATVDAISAVRGRVHLATAGLRCAAVSDANQVPLAHPKRRRWLERTLEENVATIQALLRAEPLRVLLETSAAVRRKELTAWWRRMQRFILSQDRYVWRFVVACPRKLYRKEPPRERIYVMGWLKLEHVHEPMRRFATTVEGS